jgi:predicted nucleic acid-binding protein
LSAFVDTYAFHAVMDADDDMHPDACRTWECLLRSPDAIHTTNYVLVETLALLQGRLGLEATRVFTADVLPVLTVFWVEEGVHRSAHHALLVASRRGLSLVDCVSFEAMRRLGLEEVFCFDQHFEEQGFRHLSMVAGPPHTGPSAAL